MNRKYFVVIAQRDTSVTVIKGYILTSKKESEIDDTIKNDAKKDILKSNNFDPDSAIVIWGEYEKTADEKCLDKIFYTDQIDYISKDTLDKSEIHLAIPII